jgi:hypothetical protein
MILKEEDRKYITKFKIVFSLCGSCYWCASLLGKKNELGPVPSVEI